MNASIVALEAQGLGAFDAMLAADAYLPYAYLPGVPIEGVRAMQRHRLEELAARPGCTVAGQNDSHSADGLIALEPLDWDSQVLDVPMGRVSALHASPGPDERERKQALLSAAAAVARTRGWKCMDLQTHLSDLAAANAAQCGFDLAATNIAIVWDLAQPLPAVPFCGAQIEVPGARDLQELEALARRSMDPYSRFAADARLTEKAPDLFAAWAANSVRGYADLVHIARINDRACGYCTWRVHKPAEQFLGFRLARLDLTAVAAEARGKHILTALARAGLAHWQSAGFRFAEVNTHALNGGMQRACGGLLGGRTLSARHTWHWHAAVTR